MLYHSSTTIPSCSFTTIPSSNMPLAEPNRLAFPSKIPLFRGRKPASTRDIVRQTANTTDTDDFLTLSSPQKSALVDLALYRFGEAQAGKRHNPEKAIHSAFLAKSSMRRDLGDFTNALIEGMVCNFPPIKCLEDSQCCQAYCQGTRGRQALRVRGV